MERPARRPAPPLVRQPDAHASRTGTVGSFGPRPRAHAVVSPLPRRAAGFPGFTPFVPGRARVGIANLRRNVCPHFYMTGAHGALPVHAPHLLKALSRQETTVSRCQLRGGVHLEQGYVADVCLAARFNQCVFYEDELTRED